MFDGASVAIKHSLRCEGSEHNSSAAETSETV